jgi:hypothetical protein
MAKDRPNVVDAAYPHMSTVFVTNRGEIRGREGLPLDGSFTAAAIAVGRQP